MYEWSQRLSGFGVDAETPGTAANAPLQDPKKTARLVLILGVSALFFLYLIKASHFAITEGFEYVEEAD